MADPAELDPRAVPEADQLIHEAVVLDNANAWDDEVRCVFPSEGEHLATDPMRFTPFPHPDGLYYPKRGNRALVVDPVNGPEVIDSFWPQATAEPDVPR